MSLTWSKKASYTCCTEAQRLYNTHLSARQGQDSKVHSHLSQPWPSLDIHLSTNFVDRKAKFCSIYSIKCKQPVVKVVKSELFMNVDQ